MTTARVEMWGTPIGAVTWDADRELCFFEYDRRFLDSRIELAPLVMPLSEAIYSFPGLARNTFLGLPGMLADALPDRFGNAVIDAWLASQGRTAASFNSVERLCYTGSRGTGALEFVPAIGGHGDRSEPIDVAALVDLADAVLTDRERFVATLGRARTPRAVRDILRVGTSAGGAHAKALIAWNIETGEVRSGQVTAGSGFTYWLLKFDGVGSAGDRELDMPQGYGLVEYAYHRMALAAGIEMSECRLLHEGGRSHFVTKRFDRTDEGEKLHLQSLGAVAHLDFNLAGAHSYEQAMFVIRRLGLPMRAIEEQFRRMVFNVLARNLDDHVKNIAFLMDKSGAWSLSPGFDLTYAYNPDGRWTGRHQMTLAGKNEGFERADIIDCGKTMSMRRGRAAQILDEVREAVSQWLEFAAEAGVPAGTATQIAATHRAAL